MINQTLQQQLSTDISTLSQLTELLEQEQHALRDRNLDQLNQLLTIKNDCLNRLGQTAQHRSELLKQAGFTPNDAGLEQWLQTLPSPQQVESRKYWQTVKSHLAYCQTLNEINGCVLNRLQQTLHQLLAIYRGQSQASIKLYGAQGDTSAYQDSQILGTA
ncbi:flagella synthesis protein FlgN [Spartinivicinus poritis]|uniref:Flagellar protein FlgN n=1 Tax=Spartinivicinus poritis TaxID=2994640 RepID=A0ABT5U3X0_9GAMM|nr:flagellar protein FlgN [Spartinivicinus sp. A2-2]MDE1461059.1 flagellar protein FlgN [Spartinivicinus sp. A2-2]